MWIKSLDVAERAISQDEGWRRAEGLRWGHLLSTFYSGYMVNSYRLETLGSSSGEEKRWLTLVSLEGPVKCVPREWRDLLT